MFGNAGRLAWVGTQFSPGFLRDFSLILRRDPGEIREKTSRILRKKTNQAQSCPEPIPNMSAFWSYRQMCRSGQTDFGGCEAKTLSDTFDSSTLRFFFKHPTKALAHFRGNPDKARLNKTPSKTLKAIRLTFFVQS
ncbi:hypothetical protein DDR33_06610 [Pararcticibacter amylolyticus]|uniref:Uncharacterized protein n=1 Tax=Pararcticibacter amylolyticus TaxID=2173175 RepID=A0A2U2PJB8_9SPHI|nr:hypothetical protein DDR33_06610 [Pararcticibacter amylolyticus]